MTAPGDAPAGGPGAETEPAGRLVDLALARLHLRVGLLAMARAELETLAGSADLDLLGILDLAEVRWRTGDLRGAGEAAAAYLALAARAGAQPEGPVAHAIVAEAAAARGHEAEAAEAVAGALAIIRAELGPEAPVEAVLDGLFAGMAARAPWPGPDESVELLTLPSRRLPWEQPARTTEQVTREAATPQPATPQPAEPLPAEPAPAGTEGQAVQAQALEVASAGLPAADAPDTPVRAAAALAAGPEHEPRSAQPMDDLLEAGREALVAGDPGRAAVAFGLALRSDSGAAAAIVAAVEAEFAVIAASEEVAPDDLEVDPAPGQAALAVVRGDALYALGRDAEADRSYDLARQLTSGGDAQPPGGTP